MTKEPTLLPQATSGCKEGIIDGIFASTPVSQAPVTSTKNAQSLAFTVASEHPKIIEAQGAPELSLPQRSSYYQVLNWCQRVGWKWYGSIEIYRLVVTHDAHPRVTLVPQAPPRMSLEPNEPFFRYSLLEIDVDQ